MPSISAHMGVALKVCNKINVDKNDYLKGNLLPDLYNNKIKSHFKTKGERYLVPNIDKAIKELDLNKSIDLGYLTHLLLDYYYFNEYLIKYKKDLFKGKRIYKDYDILNKDIINFFNIDTNYLKNILKDYKEDINEEKLTNNLNCLDLNINGDTTILDKEDFISFLDESSNRIVEFLNNLLKNNDII